MKASVTLSHSNALAHAPQLPLGRRHRHRIVQRQANTRTSVEPSPAEPSVQGTPPAVAVKNASSSSTAATSRRRKDGPAAPGIGPSAPLDPAAGLASLAGALQQAATRLARQVEPPPPGFPPGPPGDSAVGMLQQPLAFLERVRRQHGPLAGLLLGGERVVLVADPAAARSVLIDRGEQFTKSGTAFFPGSSLAGNGLLVSDGEVWRRQRRLANPAFRRTAVERYGQSMLASASRLLATCWRDGVAREVYADFNRLTLDITLQALFGAELAAGDAAAGREITASIQEAFRFFAAQGAAAMVLPEWVPTPDNLAFTAAVRRLDRAVLGLIAERRRELAEGPTRPPRDLLDSLLAAADEQGEGMGDRAARDEVMTLLVAGQETSAIQLSWCCAYLAHYPIVQAAAAAEVAALAAGRPLQVADAGRLPLVEAAVLEAMRLSPPAFLVGRCASRQAVTLGGYHLPQGTTLLVSPYLLHRDPASWGPDAARFRPERWLELQQAQLAQQAQQAQQARGPTEAGCSHASAASASGGSTAMSFLTGMGPNGAYIPFGAGQRNCIGTGFAMMEAVLVLASVLQQYQLQPLPGAAFPEAQPQITLRPAAVRLLLRRRI